MTVSRRLVLQAFAAAPLASSIGAASAQVSTRTIRVIVPFTPGSGSDNVARFYGEQLSRALGQPLIVENKTGAGGAIAARAVKEAPADGLTILLGNTSTMTVNPVLVKDLGYSPMNDFRALSGLAVTSGALVVPPNSPIGSFQEFIAAAKAKPLSFGTFSPAYQLAAAYLGVLSGTSFNYIPYRGQAPLTADLIGGQLDASFFDVSGTLSLLQTKRVRTLAITGRKRNEGLPDVPTIAELGLRDYVHESWMGFFVRADTPPAVSERMTSALQGVVKTDAAREFSHKAVMELFPQTPDQMREFVDSEIKRFTRVARATGIEAQ